MGVKAKWLGREKLAAQLRRLAPDIEKEAAAAQMSAAKDLAAAIAAKAPESGGKDSGRYKESIHGALLSSRPAGSAVGAQRGTRRTKDKNATGVFAMWKWRLLEFGHDRVRVQKTTGRVLGKMPKRPHIFGTYRAMKKGIRRKVASAINRAVKRAGKR